MNTHAKLAAIAQRRLELIAQMRVINDDLAKSGLRQALQMPRDERLATHHQQGLGGVVGQRPHALAAPGGQNHGFHLHRSTEKKRLTTGNTEHTGENQT